MVPVGGGDTCATYRSDAARGSELDSVTRNVCLRGGCDGEAKIIINHLTSLPSRGMRMSIEVYHRESTMCNVWSGADGTGFRFSEEPVSEILAPKS